MVNIQTQKPRYYLEIDEEGFVVFDGLRVNDEAFVKPLFESMQREDSTNPRSPLVAFCEKEKVYIAGFSSPLVAQQMLFDPATGKVIWEALYGLKYFSRFEDLAMDEWNRLHAFVGEHKVPITATRQAQTKFLLSLPEDKIQTLKSQKYRYGVEGGPRPVEMWEETYQSKQDGWDLGGPNPVLVSEYPDLKTKLPKGKILVPGAGRGHDAVFLLEQYNPVEIWDVAPSAKNEFQRIYPNWKNTKYEVGDFFELSKKDDRKNSFDGVFEHTCFCAIDPSQRQDFLNGVCEILKPNGFYFGIFYLKTSPGGPPFGLSEWELRERFKNKFNIFAWKRSMSSHPRRLGEELWVVAQKI